MMAKDILEEIVAHKRLEVERFKTELSEREIHRRVELLLDFKVASMSQALSTSDSGIIAEFKRKSPSKGWIKEEGRADIIPLSYQQNGASAVSILTDEKYFGGCDDFISTARHSASRYRCSTKTSSSTSINCFRPVSAEPVLYC